MSEQRGHIESSAAAAGGGAAGQPTSRNSDSDSSDGRLTVSSGQHPRVATISLHSAVAATADAAMSDRDSGSATVGSSPTSAAADSETTAAVDQPPSQSLAQGQAQAQPHQLAVNSMTLEEVVEAMAAVPAHPADEFVQRQLRLVDRLGKLLDIGDSASWLRAATALSFHQTLIIFQTALRVETADESADELVSTAAALLTATASAVDS